MTQTIGFIMFVMALAYGIYAGVHALPAFGFDYWVTMACIAIGIVMMVSGK